MKRNFVAVCIVVMALYQRLSLLATILIDRLMDSAVYRGRPGAVDMSVEPEHADGYFTVRRFDEYKRPVTARLYFRIPNRHLMNRRRNPVGAAMLDLNTQVISMGERPVSVTWLNRTLRCADPLLDIAALERMPSVAERTALIGAFNRLLDRLLPVPVECAVQPLRLIQVDIPPSRHRRVSEDLAFRPLKSV